MPAPDRPRVAVIYGGRSSEHAVSCITAAGVLRALDPAQWDVLAIGITRQGRWVLGAADPAALDAADGRLPEVPAGADPVTLQVDPVTPGQVVRRSAPALGAVDVVLPLLHGPYGEDGTVQGLLEMAGIPYVGSGVLASAAAMDKDVMKLVLHGRGLPVCRHLAVLPGRWATEPDRVRAEVAALGYPVFVKPARGGSSIGISRVARPDHLDAAMDAALAHDPKVLVEESVAGREVEVAVLESVTEDGSIHAQASVPGEIRVVSGHEFYDFEAKYLDEGAVALDVPADLPRDVAADVRAMALAAFAALGCEGLARVDFFVRPDGSLLVNEVNTMPGFTPVSMFPRLWAASGVAYPDLVDRMLRTALARPLGLR